jgi:hypothetical protein
MIKSRRRKVGYVARMGERGGVHEVFVGKSEARRPFVRTRRTRQDNIKMDLREVGWEAWTGSIWFRVGTGDRQLYIR